MEKEQCGNLPLPSQCSDYCLNLGVVDNCLYILHYQTFRLPVNIWVMKDYENIDSWTLEWIIQQPLPSRLDGNLRPVMTLENGSLLMIINNNTLASYNPVARLLERISYHGVSSWSESIAGVPSFLTLPGAV